MGKQTVSPLPLLRRLASFRRLLSPRNEGEGRFLVLSQSRSGSTLFTQLLNAHPDIHCAGELLRDWVPLPKLYIESHRRHYKANVFGFKVFIHHLMRDQGIKDPERFLNRMHDQGYKLLYLKRENLLRHSMSQGLRKVTGVTHTTSGVDLPSHRVDIETFMRHLRTREYFWREAEEALEGLPYHALSYEMDLENSACHQVAMDKVFLFLNLPPVTVQTNMKRINNKHLRDILANYDELVQAVSGTPYARWLEG
ncbi:MAG: sulfotransferase [Trueperaceae bacterium]